MQCPFIVLTRDSNFHNGLSRYATPASPSVCSVSPQPDFTSPRQTPASTPLYGRTTHSTLLLGGAPGFFQHKAVEGPDLRPAAHCLTPDTRPQGLRETPGPRPRGCGGALRKQPPVSFKSRRKFWESCFAACSLNNLMISRIVGNGGRRKVLSVPEVAMKPRGTFQASPRTFSAAIKSFRAWKGGRERGSIKARLRAHLIGRMYSPEARGQTGNLGPRRAQALRLSKRGASRVRAAFRP